MEVEQLARFLEQQGCRLRGCSEQQVDLIEQHFAVKLPSTYVAFLLRMGKEAGSFMLGSSAFYDEIYSLREYAIELLAENNFKPLPDNAFVFFMHQGYQFGFFDVSEGDNPPVYYYNEGNEQTDFMKEASLAAFFDIQLILSGFKL